MLESSNTQYAMLSPPDLKRGVGWQRMLAVLLGAACLIGMMCATWIFVPHMVQVENPGTVNEKTNMHAIMSATSRGQLRSQAKSVDMAGSSRDDFPTYNVSTFFGTLGVCGASPDGTPLGESKTGYVDGATILPWDHDKMLIAEFENGAVRLVNRKTGIIERTVAGIVRDRLGEISTGGDGKLATMTSINAPTKVAVDPVTKDIFIGEHDGSAVRMVNWTSGILTTVMGKVGDTRCYGDGIPGTEVRMGQRAHCSSLHPGTGDLYVCDAECHAVRKLDRRTGIVTTVAGTLGQYGWSPDGEPATKAKLAFPCSITFDPDTYDMYIAEYWSHVIRKVDGKTGLISTYAGYPGLAATSGDGGPALGAGIESPGGVVIHPVSKDLVVSQYDPADVVRLISGSTGKITTIAGEPYVNTADGDGGPALKAHFNRCLPAEFVPGTRDILVPDGSHCAIRLLKAN